LLFLGASAKLLPEEEREMIEAGIVGGSGYSGGELLRILLQHPSVRVRWVTSRGGKRLEHIHRNFYGMGLEFISLEEADGGDIVFLCTPSRESMLHAQRFLRGGARVIDLGSDFRLKNREIFEAVYKTTHTCWELVSEAPYGLTELRRGEIRQARLVANPGCFATAAILGLAPLIKEKLIEFDRIVVDGISGTSGAGAQPETPSQHAEIGNSIFAYNVTDHRHTYEMAQELSVLAGEKIDIHFTPFYAPFSRGILVACHGFLTDPLDRGQVLDLFKAFYQGEYFIQILDIEKDAKVSWQYLPYPSVSTLAGSNFCQIGIDVDNKRGRVIVFAALDNLVKGAAGAAVQNMNVMCGLPEETGLTMLGMHP
jgi:N-acetyl-gamma-glutamyl-phosphate reductase common form